jgi:hypothetical protein
MPMTIGETGLFPAAPDFSKHPASMREYAPDPPLWSDGLEKQRFLLLPKGKQIDNSDRAGWSFPVGTVFIKTFFDDGGPGGGPRPIETRLIRRVGEKDAFPEYDFYVYQWNAAGTDATRVLDDMNGDPNQVEPVTVTVKRVVDGKPFLVNGGQPFQHTLPSRNQCGDCHEDVNHIRPVFIGFDETRLNSKLTPTSPKTQLQEFGDAGIFTNPIPTNPATIVDNTVNDGGRLLRIKRFVFGNCVHCHAGGLGDVFDLHPDVFVKNTVGQPTDASGISAPKGWLRVVPGQPEKSVLFVQVRRFPLPSPAQSGGEGLKAMPPVGLADVAANQDAVKDIRDWILSLPVK